MINGGYGAYMLIKEVFGKDSQIGLKLPIPVSEISDYDLSAPFDSESCEESKIVGE